MDEAAPQDTNLGERKNQQEFVEAMSALFMTAGWRNFLQPRLRQLRDMQVSAILYTLNDPMQIMAAREAVQMLDNILLIPEEVEDVRQLIANLPEEAVNVVQSTSKQSL